MNAICDYSDYTLTVRLYGDIDHHSAKALREEIDRAIFFYRAKSVILDLSSVDFMDSSGLGLILGRYTRALETGGSLSLVNPSLAIMRIITLAGADRIIPVTYKAKADKA